MKAIESVVLLLFLISDASSGIFDDLECAPSTSIKVPSQRSEHIMARYRNGLRCRWHLESPRGTQIGATCEIIPFLSERIPKADCMAFYRSGDKNKRDVRLYCGPGEFSIESVTNLADIATVTSPKSEGGKIYCNVTVKNSEHPMLKPLTPFETEQIIAVDQQNAATARPVGQPVQNNRPRPIQNVVTTAPSRPKKENSPQNNFVSSPTSPKTCDCGRWYTGNVKDFAVVGGVPTYVNEFTMMAAIINWEAEELICGATILSKNHALTAAHCLESTNPKLGLLVGDHDISLGNDTDAAEFIPITDFIKHPNYKTVPAVPAPINDIAIVKVQRPITISELVGPACLPISYEQKSFDDEMVLIIGWGATNFGGINSNYLQKIFHWILTPEECKKDWEDKVSYKQICSYYEGKDTCQGDSGGPLLWFDGKRLNVIGVVSYGDRCGRDISSVNTRVTEYIPWIQSVLGDDFCIGD